MLKLLLVTISLAFSLGSGNTEPQNSSTNNDCPDALERFTERLLLLSARFLKSYMDSAPNASGAVSVLAELFHLESLAYFAKNGSQYETYAYTTLNLQSKEEIVCIANIINQESSNLPDCIQFLPSTEIFADLDNPFTSDFMNFMRDVIVGSALNLDFFKSYQSADTINKLAAQRTNNNIRTVITNPSIFDRCTQLVTTSALFFTGTWQIAMHSTDKVTEFRVSPSQSRPQTFLNQDAIYLYGHSQILQAQVVQINFCCEAFYMWEILPDRPFTVNVLIKKMAQSTDWYHEVIENMKPMRLDFYIPQYNKSTTADVKPLIRKATDVKSKYNKTTDLKGAIECDRSVEISVSVQTSYLVTGFEGEKEPESISQKPNKIVKVDSPHVWIIFRNSRVHFAGVTS